MDLLLIPFIVCIALVGIHVYFGQTVIQRGIIFIDLALAQWAALGYLVGHYLHIENEIGLFGIAFLFSCFAGLILTIMKPYFSKINVKEAIIGVIYILGGTLATTLISVTGMEGYHLQEMLTGHLLFTSINELMSGIVIYTIAAIGLFYLNSRFSNSRVTDFIFYSLFALVVTSSVKMVGILLVFSYLVTPILTATTLSKTNHIAIGWGIGILGSILGVILSIVLDTPPSYGIIITMITCLFLSIIVKQKNILNQT